MKLVLDTNVLIAAMMSESGASRRLLQDIVRGRIISLISVPLIIEYEAVLKRPGMMKSCHLSKRDADIVLDQLAVSMEHVEMHFLWRPALRDANDDMVLETAVNGGAELIVSFNLADYGKVPALFGIEVLRPADAIRRY